MSPYPLIGLPSPDSFAAARLLAYGSVVPAAVILLYYLVEYVRFVLAGPSSRGWWYLGIGVGACVVYGTAGLLELSTTIEWLPVRTRGAVPFVILFLSLGIRAMYFARGDGLDSSRGRQRRLDHIVLVGVITAWWTSFLASFSTWTTIVETAAWIVATLWGVRYGILTVRTHEGTSFAAIVRHLVPAVVAFVVVVFSELASRYTDLYSGLVDAIWVVGTVLVVAFLFNTAIAIRQQGAEVERKYDWTTWRG